LHINLEEYQRQVREGLFLDHGHDKLSHIALGLTGEAGEVADIVKKSQYKGRTLDRGHMIEELGDVFWYWTAAVDFLGFDIEALAFSNIVKLEQRHPKLYNSTLLTLVPR
jgi:Predicted pyrophosphatase